MGADTDDYHWGTRLATLGASTPVIMSIIGRQEKWVKRVSAAAPRPDQTRRRKRRTNPAKWLDADPKRLLDANVLRSLYNAHDHLKNSAERLVSTFESYLRHVDDAQLSLNDAYDVIELERQGEFRERVCQACHLHHLVVTERSICPVCALKASWLCSNCGAPLPVTQPGTPGRRRRHCNSCK